MTDFAAAEAAIRQLQARYTDAVWRQDRDAFGDCFTEDCEWRIVGQVIRGRSEIVGFMSGVFDRFRRILLTMRTPIIELTGNTANTRTYITEQSVLTDGQPLFAIGSYFERIVDQGDRWRFRWRMYQTEYAGSPDLTGAFFENPDWGAPPSMPPLDAIPIDHSGFTSKGA